MGLYCSKQLETTSNHVGKKSLHIIFEPWRREEIGRILLRFSKCLEGLVIFHFIKNHKLFILDTNNKCTRGHTCKLVKTQCTRDITKYFFQAKSLIGGICWTSGR